MVGWEGMGSVLRYSILVTCKSSPVLMEVDDHGTDISSRTPQALAQFQSMKANQQNNMMPGAQMERQTSQMDMTGGRNGSPHAVGEAPSPKRQRIGDGNMQPNNGVRPGPPNPMQSNQVSS